MVWSELVEAGTPSVLGKARLSLYVQQCSSGIEDNVVESKRRALHVVGREVYVRVGLISTVDLAYLAALVNTPGGIEKERSLRDTRHLSPFHVYQP